MMLFHTGEARVASAAALHPGMLWPRRATVPFPFDRQTTSYYYLARNGIFALANAWTLAGKEVLVPAYCHGVEMQALRGAGAALRYYAVHAGMQVRPEDVISRVTSRTRAVYLIHYAGFPGPVEELADFCRRRGVPLIEDCALSLLSRRGDVPLGSFGDAAIFCLYKTLPLPNGGAVVVRDGAIPPAGATSAPSLASTLSYTASAAWRRAEVSPDADAGDDGGSRWLLRDAVRPIMSRLGMVRVATEKFEPAHAGLGMSALCHRVIAAQDFTGIVERRRRNFRRLLSRLDGRVTTIFHDLPAGVCPLFFPIQTPRKRELQRAMGARGIETVDFWANDAPGVRPGEYPDVDDLRRTVLELPCHQDLTTDDIDRIARDVIELKALT